MNPQMQGTLVKHSQLEAIKFRELYLMGSNFATKLTSKDKPTIKRKSPRKVVMSIKYSFTLESCVKVKDIKERWVQMTFSNNKEN